MAHLAGRFAPLMEISSRTEVFGATITVRTWVEHAGQFEDGTALMRELESRWGPHGELAQLAAAAPGTPVPVSCETLLLLSAHAALGEVVLDYDHQQATRTGDELTWPDPHDLRELTRRLLLQDLGEAGCTATEVSVEAPTQS